MPYSKATKKTLIEKKVKKIKVGDTVHFSIKFGNASRIFDAIVLSINDKDYLVQLPNKSTRKLKLKQLIT